MTLGTPFPAYVSNYTDYILSEVWSTDLFLLDFGLMAELSFVIYISYCPMPSLTNYISLSIYENGLNLTGLVCLNLSFAYIDANAGLILGANENS